jgi:hypothetical protein
LVIVLLISLSNLYAQQVDSCKVLLDEITGSYQGSCKNGLAHGKGSAKGRDSYVGMFKDGLPEGKGKYTFENGNVFSGYWVKGLKNGTGEFKYYVNGKAFTQKGYWVSGEYVGTTAPDDLYRVTISIGMEYFSIKKVEGDENQTRISFVGAMTKYVPQDVNITISSGMLKQEIKNFIVYQYRCPVHCSIQFTYTTTGGTKKCQLEFDILKPGVYEVLISNT